MRNPTLLKTHVIRILFALVCLVAGKNTFAQQYIYLSVDGIQKYMRFDLGYTQWALQQQDSAARMARGLHLHNEVKIISGGEWNKRSAFTIHDAFYFGIDMGKLMNEKHTDGGIEPDIEKESAFSAVINMGYLAMAGYRNQKWAALGGIDFRWRSAWAGDLKMPNLDGPLFYSSFPLMARVEYGLSKSNPDFRAVLTGSSTSGSSEKRTPYKSIRLDFPISGNGRFWLCAQYTFQKALSEDVFLFTPPATTTFQQYMIGLRIGTLP